MDEDDIIEMMRQFKLGLQQQEADRMRAMGRVWLGVEQRLQADIEALVLNLARRRENGEVLSQASLFRMERYQQLLVQIQSEMDAYATYATRQATGAQREFGEQAIEHTAQNIARSGVVETAFNRLPREAVELMAGSMADGSPLSQLLINAAVRADVVDKMTAHLIDGTVRGINPRKTARLMRDDLAGGLNQALTVVRTEQMRVYREMTDQSYQASGVVQGKYRLTARGERTCMGCLVRDGEFIPLGTEMDEHPNGRCTTTAFIPGKTRPRTFLARDWFAQQDEATQRKMMGNGRYEAWADGKFELSELAQTVRGGRFGSSLQVRPLRDLV